MHALLLCLLIPLQGHQCNSGVSVVQIPGELDYKESTNFSNAARMSPQILLFILHTLRHRIRLNTGTNVHYVNAEFRI